VSGTNGPPQELVERALAAAGGLGCAVLVSQASSVNLRWALNGLTTNGVTDEQSVTVVVAHDVAGGTGVGVLTRQGIGPDDVAGLVEDATAVARGAAPAEDAQPFVSGDAAADWGDPAGTTGPSTLAGLAEGLGEVLASSRAQGREAFGFALHTVTTTWLGTSAGLRVRHEQPVGTVELTGKSHDRTRSTWSGHTTADFTDVDVRALDEQIRRRLDWQARRVDLPPGRYDTVLPPSSVADLMTYAYWSGDARSAHEGRSVFSRAGGGTRIGDRLSDVPLTLAGDPDHPGVACADRVLTRHSSPLASVFDNGLPSPAVTWLDAGVLTALPTTRHTAALTDLPTAPAVDNLVLHAPGGAGSAEDLAAGLERGLLLTSLWYIREVDPTTLLLTGLTRDGVYLVEGGEVVAAVTNFRFNDSPVDLLSRVQAVGATEVTLSREWGEWFPRTAMPALRVGGFHLSSTSEAS
jgi:predicted Zn-dependent protease